MHKKNQKMVSSFETYLTGLYNVDPVYPTHTVEINVDIIPEFVEATVSYLKTLEVEIVDTDVDTLTNVTKLQVQAKMIFAATKVQYNKLTELLGNAHRTVTHFSEGLKSSAVLIDQIGLVERNKQKFVPTLKLPVESQIDEMDNVINGNGQTVNVRVDEMNTINYPDLVRKYVHLIMRIVNKKPQAIVPINLKDGLGEMTQLVGSRDLEDDEDFTAWCAKEVTEEVLILGAGFRFGFNMQDNWHDESIHCVKMYVDVAGFLLKLMRVNDAPRRWSAQPKRQGAGAKPRQAENFRTKKSQETYEHKKEELRGYDCKYDNLGDLLSSLSSGIYTNAVQQIFEIKADVIPEFVEATVSYLKYEGVEILDSDVDTLSRVTKLQVQAKLFCSHYSKGVMDWRAFETVQLNFSRCLKSSAVLIDQIGVVERSKQTFIPTLNLPVESPNFPDLVKKYISLIDRIENEIPHAIVPINLKNSSGKMTQLVGSCEKHGFVEVWCAKEVRSSELIMGAGFRFGLNLQDTWRNKSITHVKIVTHVEEFLTKLMEVNDDPMSAQ